MFQSNLHVQRQIVADRRAQLTRQAANARRRDEQRRRVRTPAGRHR